jgi:hypothetical protein
VERHAADRDHDRAAHRDRLAISVAFILSVCYIH